MKKKKEEYNYFNEFVNNSKYIVESAEILKETVANYSQEMLEENITKVHKLENEADQALHKMRNYLIKDFLPPIDREDIVLIGHRLDDIEDFIDEILINLNILNISNVREDAIEFTELLIECANSVKDALENFENFKRADVVKEKSIAINVLEEKADRLFEKAMKKLYKEETNPVEIIKWTTIYSCMENTTDACERIADSLEDVVMKNS
ncbi:MAG: DUF47 family protein [Clostridia bacterium]|nr:DUF47 family protein [Clostridia bacterium]